MRRTKRGGWPYGQPPNVPFEINPASPQAVGLVAWWPMLGDQGGWPLRDAAYGRYPLSPFNTPTWVSDERGWSVLFDDGASEYLAVTPFAAVTPPFTMSAWFRADDIPGAVYEIMSVADKDAEWHHSLGLDWDGKAEARTYDGVSSRAASGNVAAATTWYHAAGIWAAANDRAVILAGDIGNKGADAGNRAVPNIDRATIGVTADNTPIWYFSGRICDARIYNRRLTDNEVRQLYVNPWELYKPLVRHLAVGLVAPPPVGGHMTLWGRYWGP